MSLESKPYYWVRCDNCGTDIEYGEYTAYGDQGEALDSLVDYDWTTDSIKHHCPGCPPLGTCESCGKPAGEDWQERDERCQQCWDKPAAEAIDTTVAGAS